jgi:hypothetical protein
MTSKNDRSENRSVMKPLSTLFAVAAIVLFFDAPLLAQSPLTASDRLFHTQKALLERVGTTSIAATGSFFFRGSDYIIGSAFPSTVLQANADVAVDYIVDRHLMFSASLNAFQIRNSIVNAPSVTDLLGGARIVAKVGSFGVSNNRIQLGSMLDFQIPFRGESNPPLLPFHFNEFGAGLTLIGSYFFDNIFPEAAAGIHFNLGVRSYFSSDKAISRGAPPFRQLGFSPFTVRLGLGGDVPLPIPAYNIVAFAEIFSELYIGSELPSIVYGRESFAYAVLGGKYQALDWLWVELLGQVLLIGGSESTDIAAAAAFGNPVTTLSGMNYAPFRISAGVRIDLDRRFRIPYRIDESLGLYDEQVYTQSERRRNKRVMDVLDERSQDLADIYKTVRKQDTTVYGKIYYEIVIGKRGNVEKIRLLVSSLDESPLGNFTEEQFAEAIRNWKFPPGNRDLTFDVFKIEISPAGVVSIVSR